MQLGTGHLFAGRFEIARVIGIGGMGAVYRARDHYTDAWVALKLLHPVYSHFEDTERFTREAQILSELTHPGIVNYVAHGKTVDGQHYLAMEWLDGIVLSNRLSLGPLHVRDAIRLLRNICQTLSTVHEKGIIHRDLKPSNIFLCEGDLEKVKVLDFGIARWMVARMVTRTGQAIGTPAYMAPEQARGEVNLTAAADVFALGCILGQCLTGQPLFMDKELSALLARVVLDEQPTLTLGRPEIPLELQELLGRMLVKNPAARLPDAAAVLAGLKQIPTEGWDVSLRPATPTQARGIAENDQHLVSILLATEQSGTPDTEVALMPEKVWQRRESLHGVLSQFGADLEWLADGSLCATIKITGSATDQAAQAARMALLLRAKWPSAMIVLATGRGRVEGRRAIGEVLDRAAQLLRASLEASAFELRGQIRLDELSAKLLDLRFEVTRSGAIAVLTGGEAELDASRPLLGKPTPCVGREAELNNLEGELRICIEDGEARAVVVTAPPGVGKSRLRHEFLKRAEKSAAELRWFSGRADLASAGTAYGLLGQMIRRLCGLSGSEPLEEQRQRLRARIEPEIAKAERERVVCFIGELSSIPFSSENQPMLQAARQDPEVMRQSMRRAFLDWMRAELTHRPVSVVLDDLQWADALTIALFDEALAELRNMPLFILAFGRPELHEQFPKLWQSHQMTGVVLKGLGKKACERLVQQALGKQTSPEIVAQLIEQSAGNALFLEELIRAAAEGRSGSQSETVMAMLQARISRLDTKLRRVIRAASVFGETFWLGGVAALVGEEKAVIEEECWLWGLEEAEFIRKHPASRLSADKEYGFRHALLRDAAYSLLGPADQELGHRMAGRYLQEAGERDALILADHAFRGHDLERAAMLYAQASEEAYHRNDFAGAANAAERSINCGVKGETLGRVLGVKTEVLLWRQEWAAGCDCGEAALLLLPSGSQWWCRVNAAMLAMAGNLGNFRLIGMVIENLLSCTPTPDGGLAYCAAIGSALGMFSMLGQGKVAELLRNRLSEAEEAALQQDAPTWGQACYGLFIFGMFIKANPWQDAENARKAMQVFEPTQAIRWRLNALWAYGVGQSGIGDFVGAEPFLRGSVNFAEQHNELFLIAIARTYLMIFLSEHPNREKHAEAAVLADQAIAQKQMDATVGTAYGARAQVFLAQEQFQEALDAARKGLAGLTQILGFQARLHRIIIEALLGLGHIEEARQAVSQAQQTMESVGGAGSAEVALRLAIVKFHAAAGENEVAKESLRALIELIDRHASEFPDEATRIRYLTQIPENAHAKQLALRNGIG